MNIGILLGYDGIDTKGGLANLAVADNKLTLASADRGHGIDGLGSGITWLMNTFTGYNTGSQNLNL